MWQLHLNTISSYDFNFFHSQQFSHCCCCTFISMWQCTTTTTQTTATIMNVILRCNDHWTRVSQLHLGWLPGMVDSWIVGHGNFIRPNDQLGSNHFRLQNMLHMGQVGKMNAQNDCYVRLQQRQRWPIDLKLKFEWFEWMIRYVNIHYYLLA